MRADKAEIRERQRCQKGRKDGQLCSAWAVTTDEQGIPVCIGHSPQAVAARAKGGRNSAKTIRLSKKLPAQLRPTVSLIETALEEVHTGKLTPQQGQSIASLSSSLVKVMEAAVWDDRITKLEELISAKGRK